MFKKVDTKSLEAKTAQMLKTHLQGNSIIITPISETEIAINLGTIAGVVAPDENSKKAFITIEVIDEISVKELLEKIIKIMETI